MSSATIFLKTCDEHEPADDAERDPAGHVDDEVAGRVEQVEGAAHRDHGRPVRHQRRAVVDEALALDDRRHVPRHAEAPGDRGRRERIGRRDDGAERERRRPRQPSDRRVRGHRHGDRGEEHERDRAERDRAQVPAQVAQRGEVRRVEQQRRQEDEEDELRVELDVRHAGREADEAAADHEQDRVRHVEQARQRGQRRDRDEEEEDDELGVLHRAGTLPANAPRRGAFAQCC